MLGSYRKYKRNLVILLFSFITASASGQLCNGNTGEPAFSINFGNGDNPGHPNLNVSPAYQFISSDCPDEGYYTIRKSSGSCFTDRWYNLDYDHTVDPDGYYLLINSKKGPSEIFSQRITGLCSNQTFQVGAWIVNLLKTDACTGNDIDPDLTFTITDLSNKILATYSTGTISKKTLAVWVPYNFTFKTPVGVNEVILRIISNSPAGCGNEFAIDDIDFRPCLPVINAGISGFTTSQIGICESDLKNFLLVGNYDPSINNVAIQWQESNDLGFTWTNIPSGNQKNQLVFPKTIGEHFYRYSLKPLTNMDNPSCTFTSNNIKIKISAKPFAQSTNYVFGCYGSTITMGAAGGIEYSWSGPDGFVSTLQNPEIPNVTKANTGMYVVRVIDHNGCASADSTTLTIYDAPVATISLRDTSVCEGSPVQISASGGQNYEWFPALGLSNNKAFNPVATLTESTVYTVRVYNKYTCFDTSSVRINVWKKPKAFAGPDKFTLKNRAIQLDGKVIGNDINYYWSPRDYLDNPILEKPKAAPPLSQSYSLTVVSNKGCGSSTDEMKVEVISKLFVPTAFTPNGDGINDKWTIILFEEYPKGTARVYNRSGQLVYTGFAANYNPWDGKMGGEIALPGTYVYYIDLGEGSSLLKGTITLIY